MVGASAGGGAAAAAAASSTTVRLSASYEPKFARFVVNDKSFTQQYAGIYFCRLTAMRPLLKEEVLSRFALSDAHTKPAYDDLRLAQRVLDLREDVHTVLIGTLFKDMPLRSTILEEYTREDNLMPVMERSNYASPQDHIILEDESGRIRLGGKLDVGGLCTGAVVAVRGYARASGVFEVEELVLPEMPRKYTPLAESGREGFVALVSDLEIGSATESKMASELLCQYLCGELGDEEVVSRIVRVIVAGNTISTASEATVSAFRNVLSFKFAQPPADAVRRADLLMARLASTVEVDIMPGARDPANVNLPQQAVNPCLLPNASRWASAHGVTNPYACAIGGVTFLGTSGQPVDDLAKYTSLETPLDALRLTLRCRHVAPTSPDTLPAYPFYETDPLVMDECPHVMFAGNQAEFATCVETGAQGQHVRLVSVPSFTRTHSFVLLDLATLDCSVVHLDLRALTGGDGGQGD